MVHNSAAGPAARCHCTCEPVRVSTNLDEENGSYMPTWFNKNCTQSTSEAALNNLVRTLGYLKEFTTDLLTVRKLFSSAMYFRCEHRFFIAN